MRRLLEKREVKLLAEPVHSIDAAGLFEGYASLFGVPDLGKDVVVPGAFAQSLTRRGPGGIRMLWQHDPSEPIGRWIAAEEDARGLRVRGKLNLAVERAREIHALMREGAIDGLSIGFKVERARADKATGLRRLEAARLVGDLDRDLSDAPRRPGQPGQGFWARRRHPTNHGAAVLVMPTRPASAGVFMSCNEQDHA